MDVTAKKLQTNLVPGTSPEAEDYRQAEVRILKQVQQESFPEDYNLLGTGKPVRSGSRLVTLAPEMDLSSGLIRVGGRLRRTLGIEDSILHPLDPSHPVTCLIIHHYDDQLHHPGSERLFRDIRRYYWIIRGREAVRRFSTRLPRMFNVGGPNRQSLRCQIYLLRAFSSTNLPSILLAWTALDPCLPKSGDAPRSVGVFSSNV